MPVTHTTFHGLPISVELAKGDTRRGTAPDGTEWSTKMKADYGYIRGTEGLDGDHVDVYLGPETEEESPIVFAVTQLKKPDFKVIDEQKFMLGYADMGAAKASYLSHYPDPKILGDITALPIENFRTKVMSKQHQAKKIAQFVELGMGMKARGEALEPEKVSNFFADVSIGALIGSAAGRATGYVLDKDQQSSSRMGGIGGAVAGSLSKDPTRLLRNAVALSAAMADKHGRGEALASALGAAAMDYAPEMLSGAGGAMFLARSKGTPDVMYGPQYKVAAQFLPSLEDMTESEREAKLASLWSSIKGIGAKLRKPSAATRPSYLNGRAPAVTKPPGPAKAQIPVKTVAPAATVVNKVPSPGRTPYRSSANDPSMGSNTRVVPNAPKGEAAALNRKPVANANATGPDAPKVQVESPASPAATQPKKPMSTAGKVLTGAAIGTAGLGLYGGYKGINAASDLVSQEHGPASPYSQVTGTGRAF